MKSRLAIVWILLCLWAPTALAMQGATSKAQQKKISAELAELYSVDQKDQELWDQLSEQELETRRKTRRDRVAEFVTLGQLSKSEDYYFASWLLQHGDDHNDILIAHLLASAASFDGYTKSDFMVAAALDRYMLHFKHPQRFGSQTFDEQGKDFGDTSKLLCDSIVKLYRGNSTGLNGRKVEPGVQTNKALKTASRRLAKIAKKAEVYAKKDDEKGIAEWSAAQEETLKIIEQGLLKEADDYYNAALILQQCVGADYKLTAHIMAMTAGILKHKKARALYVQTLDEFLMEIGTPPLFAKYKKPEADASAPAIGILVPKILILHADLRRVFTKKK